MADEPHVILELPGSIVVNLNFNITGLVKAHFFFTSYNEHCFSLVQYSQRKEGLPYPRGKLL